MNRAKGIQDPVVKEMERTGYPRSYGTVEVMITREILFQYINDDVGSFIDYCLLDPDIMDRYVKDTEAQFEEWCEEVLGNV